MVRADEAQDVMFGDAFLDDIQIREIEEQTDALAEEVQTQAEEPVKQIDYGEWESLISDMKS